MDTNLNDNGDDFVCMCPFLLFPRTLIALPLSILYVIIAFH